MNQEYKFRVILNKIDDLDKIREILEVYDLYKKFGTNRIEIAAICYKHDWCSYMKDYNGRKAPAEEIKEMRELFRKYGVYVMLIFDNDKLTKEEFDDEFSHYFIRLLSKWFVYYWTDNKRLNFHIRRHYKKPRQIKSIRNIPASTTIVINDDRTVKFAFRDDISNMGYEEIENLIINNTYECYYKYRQ